MATVSSLQGADETLGIEWKDPPPNRRNRGSFKWDAVLLKLQTRPGRWALLTTYRTLHGAIQSRRTTWRTAASRVGGRYEFTSRARHDGRGEVYGRFLGT